MRLSPDIKRAGALAPVFAIRTETDLGVGDTDGVRQMMDWCAAHKLSVLQVLPINETGDDNSPYNAISSLAIEPSTIAISPERIPELSPAKFKAIAKPSLLKSLRSGAVNYRLVKALKLKLLNEAFNGFVRDQLASRADRSRRFQSFLETHGHWIHDYALFRALVEINVNHGSWERWPEEHQTPQRARAWLLTLPAKRRETVTRRMLFFLYVQWIAFDQWSQLKEYGAHANVFLMGDIPIGVSRHSADVWANRNIFDLTWSGGAPPETFFKVDKFTEKWGQNWGIPLYRWDVLRQRDYDWWRARVGNIQRVFHLFRIDHVLGFFRFYAFPWKPEDNHRFTDLTEDQARQLTGGRLPGFKPVADDTPEHCEINRQQGESLLTMVRDAAGDTVVLAEDLGVVPDYVEPTLQKLGMPGFKIPHFLRDKQTGRFRDLKTYPAISLATLGTHDHDPLAAYWQMLWQRVDNSQTGDDTARWQADQARFELGEWMRLAGMENEPPPRQLTPRVHEGCLRAVLESNSWLAVFMITDIFAQTARFNVPGAHADSNWTARLEWTTAELMTAPELKQRAECLAHLITQTGRNG